MWWDVSCDSTSALTYTYVKSPLLTDLRSVSTRALPFVFQLLSRRDRRVPQDITTATAGTRRSLPGNGREREQRGDRGGGGAGTAGPIRLDGASFHSDTSQTPTPSTPPPFRCNYSRPSCSLLHYTDTGFALVSNRFITSLYEDDSMRQRMRAS